MDMPRDPFEDSPHLFAPTVVSPLQPRVASAPTESALPLRFVGSGRGYGRLWIVNLLLTVLTLGLYGPFARARRLHYFRAHTLVGEEPLGCHPDPRATLREHGLVLLLIGMCVGLWQVAPRWLWVPLLALALLVPLLWRAALREHWRHTRWRGQAFAFQGSLAGVYRAWMPTIMAAALLAGVAAAARQPWSPALGSSAERTALGALGLLLVLALPWLVFRICRYRQEGYTYLQQRTQLSTTLGRFYRLYGKALALLLLGQALLIGLWSLLTRYLPLDQVWRLSALSWLLLYLVLPGVALVYLRARQQNLLWNHTRSADLRFESHLRCRDLLRVTLVNGVLIVLTLGLYWPFAVVRTARLRLEAVSVWLQDDFDTWTAHMARVRSRAPGLSGV